MDEDLLAQAEQSLAEAVDDAMAEWEDTDWGLHDDSYLKTLSLQYMDEHSGDPDYLDPSNEGDWETAGFAAQEAVYRAMMTNRGWVLGSQAFEATRKAVAITAGITAMIAFALGRLI